VRTGIPENPTSSSLVYTVIAIGIILLAVSMMAVTLLHARQPVYRLPIEAVVTAVVAGTISVIATAILPRLRRPRLFVLSAVATFLFAVGRLTILSIGFVLLIGAAVFLIWLFWSLRGISGKESVPALASGAALGFGLMVLLIVSLQPPAVTCYPDGEVRVSTREWWGGGHTHSSGSGSGSAIRDGTSTGAFTVDGRSYHFVCQDGQLIEFSEGR
jgi:hypothetical protein